MNRRARIYKGIVRLNEGKIDLYCDVDIRQRIRSIDQPWLMKIGQIHRFSEKNSHCIDRN